jgi:hypothetical protein
VLVVLESEVMRLNSELGLDAVLEMTLNSRYTNPL